MQNKIIIAFLIFLNKYKTFIIYSIIGISGASLDFLAFLLLTKYTPLYYLFANVISVTLGITNNFLLNAYFNFKITDTLLKRFIKFYLVGLSGLALSSLLLFIMIDFLNVRVLLSKFLTIFAIVLMQFNLNKFITFKELGMKKENE